MLVKGATAMYLKIRDAQTQQNLLQIVSKR